MEEIKKDSRWERLNSSELSIRGGLDFDWAIRIVTVVTMVLSVIRDYLPSFVKGFRAGKKAA